jgi:succinate dehydrogenase / fumarate reductase iron-sulfur subunit
MSIQDCLTYIRENLDPSLAFFINCRLGFCKRCLVKVNGKSCLACLTEVEEDFLIEPVLKNKVIRDLWIKDL